MIACLELHNRRKRWPGLLAFAVLLIIQSNYCTAQVGHTYRSLRSHLADYTTIEFVWGGVAMMSGGIDVKIPLAQALISGDIGVFRTENFRVRTSTDSLRIGRSMAYLDRIVARGITVQIRNGVIDTAKRSEQHGIALRTFREGLVRPIPDSAFDISSRVYYLTQVHHARTDYVLRVLDTLVCYRQPDGEPRFRSSPVNTDVATYPLSDLPLDQEVYLKVERVEYLPTPLVDDSWDEKANAVLSAEAYTEDMNAAEEDTINHRPAVVSETSHFFRDALE